MEINLKLFYRIVGDFTSITDIILLEIFLWCFVTICGSLLMVQLEIVKHFLCFVNSHFVKSIPKLRVFNPFFLCAFQIHSKKTLHFRSMEWFQLRYSVNCLWCFGRFRSYSCCVSVANLWGINSQNAIMYFIYAIGICAQRIFNVYFISFWLVHRIRSLSKVSVTWHANVMQLKG